MSVALLPALALTLLTTLFVYVLWYIFRGRHAKGVTKKKQESQNEAPPENGKAGKWGVPKDSYCYPTINDILGWEFVHVVQIEGQEQYWETEQDKGNKGRSTERKWKVNVVATKNGQSAEDAFAGLNRGNEIPDIIGKDEDLASNTTNGTNDDNGQDDDYDLTWPEYNPENEEFEISDSDFDKLITRNRDKVETPVLSDDEKEQQKQMRNRMEMINKALERIDESGEEIMNQIEDIEI